MDAASLKSLCERVHSEAPLIATRELLEATAGRKCSRIEMSGDGVDRLSDLSREFGFGMCLGRKKVLVRQQSCKGDWADGTASFVDLSDSRGLFVVYLAYSYEAARAAREAEEYLGDDAFGELLGIPRCCRRFYSDNRLRAQAMDDDYVPFSVEASGQGPYPAGANICSQYFDAALFSYVPCTFWCSKTRRRTARTLAWLTGHFPLLADAMVDGHRSSYLLLPNVGIARFRDTKVKAVVGFLSAESAAELWTTGGDAILVEVRDVW